jgi:hypothetical protein
MRKMEKIAITRVAQRPLIGFFTSCGTLSQTAEMLVLAGRVAKPTQRLSELSRKFQPIRNAEFFG